MLPDFPGGAMRIRVALGCVVLAAVSAHAQGPGEETLRSRLRALAVAAELLEHRLPAFACHETFTSQELRGGKVKREMHAAGELRVQPDSDGKLDETFQATEVNGRPHVGFPRVPMFVSGGFKNALSLFHPADQRCFSYRLSGTGIEFESRPEATGEVCRQKTGITGFAGFDEAGNLVHIEHRVEEERAHERNVVPIAALDVSRIDLGGTTFMLSTHVVAEGQAGKSTYRWEASYTGCRLYQVTVKIGEAAPVPDDAGK
jgi:hypothetical protein